MSSSGNAVGITSAYIRDAQDVTLQRKRRLVFQEGTADTHTPNGNERYLTSLLGAKECPELSCSTIPDTLTVLRYSTYQGDSFLWDGDIFTRNANYPGYLYTGISSIATTVPNPTALIGVILGSSVTSIGPDAFGGTSLTSIEIPDSVTSIGYQAFKECFSLSSITIPSSVTGINSGAFVRTGLITVQIPDSVNVLDESVFYECASLTTVIIGNSVEIISGNSFAGCTSLTSITIPDSVTSITINAFENSGLATVYIADGQLGKDSPDTGVSFFGATVETILPLTTTILTYENTQGASFSWNGATFTENTNLPEVSYTAVMSSISSRVPQHPFVLSVILGNLVGSIGNNIFLDCSLLQSIEIPDSVETIGNNAFQNCYALSSVTMGESVETIGTLAFDNCTALESITIPSSVTSIATNAFYRCDNLETVTIAAVNPFGILSSSGTRNVSFFGATVETVLP